MNTKLLLEGVSDAVGFVGGALVGFWIGRLLGLDLFAPGYGNASVGAIVLVGLGGGIGLQLARKWRSRSSDQPKE
jgi:F0F1-type ATP synthase assembly protein I